MAASIQTSSSILSSLFRPSHSHKTRFSTRLLKLKHFHIFCRRMASASAPVGQDKVTAQYGSWKSPITADVVSGAEKRLSGIAVDGAGRLLWVESRPSEAGRKTRGSLHGAIICAAGKPVEGSRFKCWKQPPPQGVRLSTDHSPQYPAWRD